MKVYSRLLKTKIFSFNKIWDESKKKMAKWIRNIKIDVKGD